MADMVSRALLDMFVFLLFSERVLNVTIYPDSMVELSVASKSGFPRFDKRFKRICEQ